MVTQFTQPELRQALFCGILALVIDFGIDKEEEARCMEFLQTHWQPGYGDQSAFYQGVFAEVQEFVVIRSQLESKLANLIQKLKVELSQHQLKDLLQLMEEVVLANQVETLHEKNLLQRFHHELSL